MERQETGDQSDCVLRKFSLQIEAGEKIAFVGRSGEGKSTLLQLLCRLYEPGEGAVYVDDVNLTDYTLSSLRRQIAVVQYTGDDGDPVLSELDPGGGQLFAASLILLYHTQYQAQE